MSMVKHLVAALGILMVSACTRAETGSAPLQWRFAIEETTGSVQDAYARRFAELVEERSGGAVDVVVYPYGTLGTSDHILEQLHMGTLELAMSSPGHLGKFIPEVQVFLLHFALSDDAAVNRRALADPQLTSLLDTIYADKGLRLADVFSEGWMAWTTRRPLHGPKDFEGMKFRVMTSPLLIAAYSAYGASPTPLPYSEVYSALQLHMIDGQVNPVFAIQEMSFYEVTDYLTFANQAPFITTVVMNPAFHDSLSPELREMVDDVLVELDDYVFDVEQRFNRERLEWMRSKRPELTVVRLDEAEREAFRRAAAPVRDTYLELAGERGATLLEVLEASVDRAGG
jgi:tripartite ATP-independent transporter DctP family solute receptor